MLSGTQRAVAANDQGIVAALDAAGGIVSRAATQLGLSRQALYRRLERYGITS
jgi:transcriptional regulator of acetoin/glycerol metabolism